MNMSQECNLCSTSTCYLTQVSLDAMIFVVVILARGYVASYEMIAVYPKKRQWCEWEFSLIENSDVQFDWSAKSGQRFGMRDLSMFDVSTG